MTAPLKFHQCWCYCWVLLGHIHQPSLVLDGVELEEDLLVELNPPLEDSDQDLKHGNVCICAYSGLHISIFNYHLQTRARNGGLHRSE